MPPLENPNDRYASARRQMFIFIFVALAMLLVLNFSASKKGKDRPQQQQQQTLDGDDIIIEEGETPDETVDEAPDAPETTASTETDVVAEVSLEPNPLHCVAIGSMDPQSPYQMLVTLTSRGAAVTRVELNSPGYHSVQDRTGWMGQIVADLVTMPEKGCPVQVVGAGTPAERAGLKPGDIITGFDNQPVLLFDDLRQFLLQSRPNRTHQLTVLRNRKEISLDLTLTRAPLALVRPENSLHTYNDYTEMTGLHGHSPHCLPLSFQMTMNQIDTHKLAWPEHILNRPAKAGVTTPYDRTVERELKGLQLRSDHWEVVSQTENTVVFRQFVPRGNLEVRKTYSLEPVAMQDKKPKDAGYALSLRVEVINKDAKSHTVAYQLDGPNGLPLEGAWYAQGRKTGPGWSSYGIRDLVVRFTGQNSDVKRCYDIGMDNGPKPEQWQKTPLDYLGVDTQFFQCTMIPQKEQPMDVWHSYIVPMRVGDFVKPWPNTTNISFRMVSEVQELKPNESIDHTYVVFAGPKSPDVLEAYGLRDTLYYGWFAWFVKLMLVLLHFFHSFTFNFALAIIMLTIVVRLCLYRLSRKQVVNSMKMQALKPEMDAINEKYKTNPEAKMKAMQELYRKHKFNPAAGCLPLFIQLPILIALYKALSVDVELFGAPMISSSIRWCSDLAAPDMLFNWSSFWSWLGLDSFNTGYGMLYLGPYLNILPIITVALFLVQQQVMMPPPTTDQEKQMRTMMKFMMFFMAFMFYKVPSGLCIYFIASTLFGLAEKRFMPKAIHLTAEEQDEMSSKPQMKQKNSKPEKKELTGWRKKWHDLLEEAKHRPGDSQKPSHRKKKY